MLVLSLQQKAQSGLTLAQVSDLPEMVKNVGVPAAVLLLVFMAIGWFFSHKFWPDIVRHWKAQESAATRAYESQCATLKKQVEYQQALLTVQSAEYRQDMERREIRWLDELAKRDALLDRMQARQDNLFHKWSEEMQLMNEIVESLRYQIQGLDTRPVRLVVEQAMPPSAG